MGVDSEYLMLVREVMINDTSSTALSNLEIDDTWVRRIRFRAQSYQMHPSVATRRAVPQEGLDRACLGQGNAREWGTMGLEEYLVTKTLAGKPPSKL